MKIALVNVKYSANLGDGVISECLEHGLRERIPDIDIINCDLAGRTEYGAQSGVLRSAAISILPAVPAGLKKNLLPKLLETVVRRKLMPGYRDAIEQADVVLFGGGQLLADADLNFPMKIAAAASIARNLNLPIAIHAVGVGETWSPEGAMLFKEAFVGSNLIWTRLRDDLSRKRWRRHFNGADVPAPGLSLDPGLIGAKHYGPAKRSEQAPRNRPRIGVGVTDPSTVKLHSDSPSAKAATPDAEFYRACVEAISKNDCDVTLFTNGAHDDESFMRSCFPKSFLRKYDEGQVHVADRSLTPRELVSTIREFDGVVSHRLHASIVSYAYRIPHVGLATNRKMDEFFAVVGRTNFLLGPTELTPNDVAEAIKTACETPISQQSYQATIGGVEADFDVLARTLRGLNSDGRRALAPRAGL